MLNGEPSCIGTLLGREVCIRARRAKGSDRVDARGSQALYKAGEDSLVNGIVLQGCQVEGTEAGEETVHHGDARTPK